MIISGNYVFLASSLFDSPMNTDEKPFEFIRKFKENML